MKKVVSSGSGMIAKATNKMAGKSMMGVMPMPGGKGMGKGKKMGDCPRLQVLD